MNPRSDDALPFKTIRGAAKALYSGRTSSHELVTTTLERIRRVDANVGAFVATYDESALAAAATADRERANGTLRGPLHGVPIAVKDVIAKREGPTTAQSRASDPSWWRGRDATVVARLRAAGAVVVGATTTHEFALAYPDEDSPFPTARNPWDLARYPGGTSSGSACAVAAGFVPGSLGTDTGGSIRLPSAFCGVTGLKPTFGRVPLTGMLLDTFTMDHIGPIARTAWDCAALLTTIAGPDAGDVCSAARPTEDWVRPLEEPTVAGLRVGVVVGLPDVPDSVGYAGHQAAAIDVLAELGATVREVRLPLYDLVGAATRKILVADVAALHHGRAPAHWADYGTGCRTAIGTGVTISAAEYAEAMQLRSVAATLVARIWDDVDVLVMPVTESRAPLVAEMDASALTKLASKLRLNYWDALGHPAMSLPVGFDQLGMPIGVQVVGRPFDEATVLRVGHAYQEATHWHEKLAPLTTGTATRASATASNPQPSALQENAVHAAREVVRDLLREYGVDPLPGDLDAVTQAHLAGRAASIRIRAALGGTDGVPLSVPDALPERMGQ